MSAADLEKWQSRYARSEGPGEPDTFFTGTAVQWLPSTGTALDLAGGTGRHALWLASRGLDTTLIDVSPAGLEKASAAAEQRGLRLRTLAHDLDDGLLEGTWDVVLVSYFLVRPWLSELHSLLRPGGVLLLVHPTASNLERHPRPSRRWLYEDGEITGIPGLETLHLEESWGSSGHHELRYVGRRSE